MKTLKFLFVFVALIGLVGCAKKDNEEITSFDVEKYIELLKSNQFDSTNIPTFSSKDIPSLLKYRNDNHIVNRFPANPISSYAIIAPKYKLGVLVLWTIESIRAVSIKSTSLIGHFPSQNPFIALRNNPSEWILDYNSKAYEIISQAYFDWWENNKYKKIDQFKNIDPLKNTDYKWH